MQGGWRTRADSSFPASEKTLISGSLMASARAPMSARSLACSDELAQSQLVHPH
jgi:hypothetical protein